MGWGPIGFVYVHVYVYMCMLTTDKPIDCYHIYVHVCKTLTSPSISPIDNIYIFPTRPPTGKKNTGEAPPPGYSLVDKTASGRPLKELALAVRRQAYDAMYRCVFVYDFTLTKPHIRRPPPSVHSSQFYARNKPKPIPMNPSPNTHPPHTHTYKRPVPGASRTAP